MKLEIKKLLKHAEEGFDIPCRPKTGGVDLFAKSYVGDTLLHVAVARDNLVQVKYLLEKGLDVNAKGDYMETPLFLASINKNNEMVDLLLRSGADPSIPDHAGNLPKIQ